MKKHFINKAFFASIMVSLFFTSCNEIENDTTDARSVKPVVTANQTNFTIEEGETATVTLTTATALNLDMTFKLELVGGTGSFGDYMCSGTETSDGDGFGAIGHIVTVPAYASTGTFDITPIFDLLPEGTETLQFRLYSDSYSRGAIASGSDMINVSVINKTSSDFVTVLDWTQTSANSFGSVSEGSYLGTDGNQHGYCDLDFDLEIYDEFETSVVADSYSSCPESITLDATTPDGTYVIVPSLWTTTGNSLPASDFFFKVKVTMSKPGVFIKEINVDNNWKFSEGGAQQGNPSAYYPIARLTKTGTNYVVKDYTTGDVLASGKLANFKLKSKKNKI
ncbi:hypothetical protein [uncultured Flavobacterium sp.]|uniref:hypothetical protein n=1 Tax=uncultured Flavobacterium sp. TaxID=165435 RepID=UPI0030ED6580|tara:strand:+ start:20201 stop:21211 length:1011 start_codon:yes stop_codon:yes gene_type:complete